MAKEPTFETVWLVWVQSLTGPTAQVWRHDGGRCVGPSDLVVLTKHRLKFSDEYLSLKILAELYPLTPAQEAA